MKIGAFPPAIEEQFLSVFTLVDGESLRRDPSQAERIGGIVTRSNYRISTELIDSLPNLRIITTSGVGYDGIPVDYAARKGIVVTNTPDILNKAVAELAIGLLLALLRHLPAADRFVRTGAWTRELFPLGTNLAGKKIGIVGLGRIGMEIVQRVLPFEVDVAYYGRRAQAVPWQYFDSLPALAEHADVLILSCPGGAATRHIVDATVLKSLGADGIVVNISRGTVIKETDLCQALADGTIRGAALDVFDTEPLLDSPLRSLPNVVLSPHIGSATQETRRQMADLAIRNLAAFFTTGKAVTPVK
ncbi:2-hydroxyacid dehydrogenase [Bordetella petrii]|uniref:2-hydroxyacid dehydrogenase n=1 Tax=Bordetella petrii TaxID=94624 RepID=UPI001F60C4CB|nr:2-hydroxyacid dehydrogenase [Bordetella petrii]